MVSQFASVYGLGHLWVRVYYTYIDVCVYVCMCVCMFACILTSCDAQKVAPLIIVAPLIKVDPLISTCILTGCDAHTCIHTRRHVHLSLAHSRQPQALPFTTTAVDHACLAFCAKTYHQCAHQDPQVSTYMYTCVGVYI